MRSLLRNSANRSGLPVVNTETGPSISTGEVFVTNKPNGVDGHSMEAGLQSVLGGTIPSSLEVQKLQEYIGLLQAKCQQFEAMQKAQTPSRHQVFYRLLRREDVKLQKRHTAVDQVSGTFFDHPEWVRGENDVRHAKCSLPLDNFDLYLEKNKDISFIVYRNFDPNLDSTVAKSATNGGTKAKGAYLPKPTGETIRPVGRDLIEAIKAILESREEYAQLLANYKTSHELPAPYLFIYHSRNNLDDILDKLSFSAQKQLSLLSNYVTEQYSHEYAAADYLLSQNKISPEYIQYLFKPGDVLVSRIDGQYIGCVATSWPKFKSTRVGASVGARVGQEIRLKRDKITVHIWSVDTWSWDFDGNFQRKNKTLQLEIPADEDECMDNLEAKGKNSVEAKTKKNSAELTGQNIAGLNVFPIQYASAEIAEKLRQRGKTFWKCRTRCFVSYQENENESVQTMVSHFMECT